MNKVRLISILCLLLCGMTLSAQTYEEVLRDNFWNASGNITGMRQSKLSGSYAELFAGYDAGGFRDTWQAAQSWNAGAVTASIQHLDKMSLKGSFSFTQTEGYGMCGSMFIKPGYYPVDILEFTPGRKTLQTYAFDGGLAYDLSASWRIGAMMDFESANLAKRKDLRHSNWRLDMTVAPGFMYHDGAFAIGANYLFRKTSETVEAEQIGISESSYYAFLDKGLMYGVYSVWTGSGLHLDEAGVKAFPVNEFSNGAAVQMQYEDLFAEVEYIRTSGRIGEKEYIWFRFPGNEVSVRAGYKHFAWDRVHYARMNFNWQGRQLHESVLEKVSVGGVSTVIDHGQNMISTESSWTLNPEYEYVSQKVEVLASAYMAGQKKVVSQMYPYVAAQSLLTYRADVKVTGHFGMFSLSAGAGYSAGSVREDNWMTGNDTGVQTSPYRLQEWYDRHMDYMTAHRLNTGLTLRCSFEEGIYIEVSGAWTHAFSLKHIAAPNRFGTTLKLGYNF